MDIAQFKITLEKYGKDKLIQIIWDNSRIWLLNKPKRDPKDPTKPLRDENGKLVFYTFDELVTIDEENECLVYREYQPGWDAKTRDKICWDIVTPIEFLQGYNFIPADMSPEDEYRVRATWDHTIV